MYYYYYYYKLVCVVQYELKELLKKKSKTKRHGIISQWGHRIVCPAEGTLTPLQHITNDIIFPFSIKLQCS